MGLRVHGIRRGSGDKLGLGLVEVLESLVAPAQQKVGARQTGLGSRRHSQIIDGPCVITTAYCKLAQVEIYPRIIRVLAPGA